MAIYKNITGELTQQLINAETENTIVESVLLTNIEGTNKCTVDMYAENSFGTKVYLIKTVTLPIGASLLLDNEFFKGYRSEGSKFGFSLYIKLTKSASETPAVDIIIN